MINIQKLANNVPLDTLIQHIASLAHPIIFDGNPKHPDSQYSILTACPESIQVLQRSVQHPSKEQEPNQQKPLYQHLKGRPIFNLVKDNSTKVTVEKDHTPKDSAPKDSAPKDYAFESLCEFQTSHKAAQQFKKALDDIYSDIRPFSEAQTHFPEAEASYPETQTPYPEALAHGNPKQPQLPFTGGLMGYLSYDFGCAYKDIRGSFSSAKDNQSPCNKSTQALFINQNSPLATDPNSPHSTISLAEVGLYSWAIIEHHTSRQRYLMINKDLISPSIRTWLNHWLSSIDKNEHRRDSSVNLETNRFSLTTKFCQGIGFESYQNAFSKLKDYIQAGDCYQTNLTQRFSAQCKGSLTQAFVQVKQSAQSPFMGLYKGKNATLLSLSPERFIQCQGPLVETKPIKGTCKRSKNIEEDQKLALTLQKSIKNQAENLMIVDLLRNDIAINCLPGSVKVPKLFALESFPNVHHLVSTILGTLKPERTPLDLLFDAFPGGSITGAPKNRAMEIINELETHPRGPYCGSLFHLSADGNMDSNILIRSFVQQGQHLYCWAGGGIVSDSEVNSEFQESLDKVQLFINALESCYFTA